MQDFQKRVVDEKVELDSKITSLSDFFLSEVFYGLPQDEQSRLKRQHLCMSSYSDILEERILNFG